MTKIDAPHHVFVDFENVPTVNLEMVATQPVAVTLLIGEKQKRMDLTLVRQIHQHAAKVTLVEVGASGRNALDLVLACHLGRAAAQHPERRFYIVSKDKDFNPLIAHLRAEKVDVTRHDSFDALPFLAAVTARPPASAPVPAMTGRAAKPEARRPVRPARLVDSEPASAKAAPPAKEPTPEVSDRLAKLIDRLQHRTKARPVRRKTLLSHINAFHANGLAPAEVEAIVDTLIARGLITIDERGRVTYL
jgi:hypothetical protein